MPANKKQQVKSKYFTIDSYFKSVDSKIITKTDTELCLVCNEEIQTKSVSMEVHVNICLDKQEKTKLGISNFMNNDIKDQPLLENDSRRKRGHLTNEGCEEKSSTTLIESAAPLKNMKETNFSPISNTVEKRRSLVTNVKKDLLSEDLDTERDFYSAISSFKNSSLSPGFDSFFSRAKDKSSPKHFPAKPETEGDSQTPKRVLPPAFRGCHTDKNSLSSDDNIVTDYCLTKSSPKKEYTLSSPSSGDGKKEASFFFTKTKDLSRGSHSTDGLEGKENDQVSQRVLPQELRTSDLPKKGSLKPKDINIPKPQGKASEFSLFSITDGSLSHKRKGDTNTPPPTLWKSLFAMRTPNENNSKKNPSILDSKASSSTKKKRMPKICPFYKYVKDTRFVVDAFSYGELPNCSGYFLSHYHSDHYTGLRSSWSHGPIYCSQVTANLVRQELKVDPKYIHALPMNKLCQIPQTTVQVALIDANHCPGSVLFLFVAERPDKTTVRHLHTGDFRASPRMCIHPLIRQPDNPPIQSLYLDTTYLSPQYAFPAQEECIKAVCNIVQKEMENHKYSIMGRVNDINPFVKLSIQKKKLFVVGTYTVGKERVFLNIAKKLNVKIYAPQKKLSILKCLEDEELRSMLTENPREAQVHVISLRDIRADKMAGYLCSLNDCFDSLVAFKPTGWTYRSSKVEQANMTFSSLSDIVTPPSDRSLNLTPYYNSKNIKLFGVPYSEHSSFRELASFIASLTIGYVVPTVNTKEASEQLSIINQWQMDKAAKRTEVVPYFDENYW